MEGTDVTQIRGLTDGLGTETVIGDKGYPEQLKQFCSMATRDITLTAFRCPNSPL
jgi:hypothetical protein